MALILKYIFSEIPVAPIPTPILIG